VIGTFPQFTIPPIQTTTSVVGVRFRSTPRPEHAVGQADPCPGTTTTVPEGPTTSVGGSSGSLPPTGLLPPTGIQTLPVTGSDTTTEIVIAALLFLAGSTSVMLTRRRHSPE
jgi:LPXTG-motif cell wall-anchored protein